MSEIFIIKDTGKGVITGLTPDKVVPIKVPQGGGTTGESYIEITKSQLDSHITNSTLKPNVLYKITGVQPFLYGGTDIYLQAISTTELAKKGVGKFFVPKYDKSVDGYGIFKNLVKIEVTNPIYSFGDINTGDEVTTNNGAVGIFYSVNLIDFVSGDWQNATEMYVNGITFNITSVELQIYNINDEVIWGGKLWKNITGERGSVGDIFTLSSDWEVIPFNETDYNVEYDEIGYDVENDCINYRKDKFNNIAEFNYNWWNTTENTIFIGSYFTNPIKSFQWGNHFDNDLQKGNINNIIINSFIENINSGGSVFNNTVENNSYIANNIIIESSIRDNTLHTESFIADNILEKNCRIDHNNIVFSSSIGYNNLALNKYISGNKLSGSSIRNNNFIKNINNFYWGGIVSNNMNGSEISNNVLTKISEISFNNLINAEIRLFHIEGDGNYDTIGYLQGIINKNSIRNFKLDGLISGVLSTKRIVFLEGNGEEKDTGSLNLSTATHLFANYTKKLYVNAANVIKIEYRNSSDVLQIANIND